MKVEILKDSIVAINNQLNYIDEKLKKCPAGKIICARNGKYSKWYVVKNKKSHYLPKSERNRAIKLATKKYYETQKKELLLEKKCIEKIISYYDKQKYNSEDILQRDSPYRDLIFAGTGRKDPLVWINEKYDSNLNYPETLKYKTKAGHKVRSKSEMIIANLLFENDIPYRYECKLALGGIDIYPDFTILCPKSGKTIYWEHFGLADNSEYMRKALNKIQTFHNNGFYPEEHLIMTFETAANPLDIEDVARIVEKLKNS